LEGDGGVVGGEGSNGDGNLSVLRGVKRQRL